MEFTEKLETGRAVGGWCSLPSPAIAEVLAGQGFDFLCLDTEHAPSTTETIEDMIRAVEAASDETAPIVRVAWNDHVRIKRLLDSGPAGVMVPQVNSEEAARELVSAVRYPPQGDAATGEPGRAVDADGVRGQRGVAGSRASDYGASLDRYVHEANDDIAVIAQIETIRAVEAAADVASVPGIDALFVGPADLSATLGRFREFDHPTFEAALNRVLAAGADAGVPVGTLTTTEEGIDPWVDAGFDFLVAGTDAGYLASGARRAIDRYHESVE